MNNAVFAIPGLMPPTAPHWTLQLKSPEDGSLCMLLHAGKSTDKVSYAIALRGKHPGVIKDPGYEFTGNTDFTTVQLPHQAMSAPVDTSRWPDFLRVTDTLPEAVLIPRRACNGCLIPLHEWPFLKDLDTVWYWILELPVRALPVGDSVVEVCVNGRVHKYTVQRPAFAIHRKDGRTALYYDYVPVYAEDAPEVHVDIQAGKQGSIAVELSGLKAKQPKVALDDMNYAAKFSYGTVVLTADGTLNGDTVEFVTPSISAPNTVAWELTYARKGKAEQTALPLVSGTAYIV